MLNISIPGFGEVEIRNLILDYNGTIAKDGKVCKDVKEKIKEINKLGINIHVLTADTNNTVNNELEGLNVNIRILTTSREDIEKKSILMSIGDENSLAIGNGNNDSLMIKSAKIGIAVIGHEGVSAKLIGESDIVVNSIMDAFDFIIYPNRLKATLRT